MIKREEILNPRSCFNKARYDEILFVLLARDAAAPVAIRAWIAERVRLGLNLPGDQQLVSAEEEALTIEELLYTKGDSR